MRSWPVLYLSLRCGSVTYRPELLELPGYDKLEAENRALTQILHDLTLADNSLKGFGDRRMASQMREGLHNIKLADEFSKSLRPLWKEASVSVLTVFAARLILDISEIRDNSQPHNAMLEAGKQADKVFGWYVDETGTLDTGDIRWRSADNELMMDTYGQVLQIRQPTFPMLEHMMLEANPLSEGFDLDDASPEIKAAVRQRMIENGMDPDDGPTEEHKQNAQKLNPKMIRPNDDGDYALKHNALMCGTLVLKLATNKKEAGIALANHHMSIFATAHLYNGVRQLKLSEVQWPEMERIIELHKSALFANDIPTTPGEMIRRMAYRTGMQGNTRPFNEKKIWKFRSGSASGPLKKLIESHQSLEGALMQLEDQVEEHELAAMSMSLLQPRPHRMHPNNPPDLPKKPTHSSYRHLTPLQLLSRLETYSADHHERYRHRLHYPHQVLQCINHQYTRSSSAPTRRQLSCY